MGGNANRTSSSMHGVCTAFPDKAKVALAYIYKIDRGEFASEPEIIIPQDMQFNEQGQLLEDN